MAMNKDCATRWGLALSGGGARGIIHLGVLKAMDEAGMAPVCIAGTSMGAIIGGLYAAGVSPDRMLGMLTKKSWYNMFGFKASFSGLLQQKYLQSVLDNNVPERFESLQIPLFVGVTNLTTKDYEVFREGPLHKPLLAAASMPVLFAPVEMNGMKYVDGGVIDNLPSSACFGHCDKILGVDVNNMCATGSLDNMKSVAVEIFHIVIHNNSKAGLQTCDEVIRPELGSQYEMFDFSKTKELYEIGYMEGHNWVQKQLNKSKAVSPD